MLPVDGRIRAAAKTLPDRSGPALTGLGRAALALLVALFAWQAVVTLDEPSDLSAYGQVMEHIGTRTTLRIERSQTASVTARLLSEYDVRDLTVEDPPIDDVIELAFASGTVER